jgi:hypothetical protein
MADPNLIRRLPGLTNGKPRSRFEKFVGNLLAALLVLFSAYGFIRFYDGPIRPCAEWVLIHRRGEPDRTPPPSPYCGKQGQPHTREDYDAYTWWETRDLYAFCAVGALGAIRIIILGRSRI